MRQCGAVSTLAVGAISLAVAGCALPHVGGSGPGGTSGSSSLSACMRAHGIRDYPDLAGGKADIQVVNGTVTVNGVHLRETQAQFQTAAQVCARAAGAGSASTPPSPVVERDALAYAQCMRAHGVAKFPDPTFHSGIQFADHGGYDPNSSAFLAAQSACQSDLTAADDAYQSATRG